MVHTVVHYNVGGGGDVAACPRCHVATACGLRSAILAHNSAKPKKHHPKLPLG